MPPAFGVSHDRKPEANVIQLSKCHNYILQYNVDHQVVKTIISADKR